MRWYYKLLYFSLKYADLIYILLQFLFIDEDFMKVINGRKEGI